MRIAVTLLGLYTGILGILHGIFELQQGSVAPSGIFFNAIGTPCEAENIWHACFPAITFIPNLMVSGILSIIFSTLALIWVLFFIEHRRGGSILILTSLCMICVGAGILPPMYGVFAGLTARQMHSELHWWKERQEKSIIRFLKRAWLPIQIIFPVWVVLQWLLGTFANEVALQLTALFQPLEFIIILFMVLSAFSSESSQYL